MNTPIPATPPERRCPHCTHRHRALVCHICKTPVQPNLKEKE